MRIFILFSLLLVQLVHAEPMSCQFRSDADRALGQRVLRLLDQPPEDATRVTACPGKRVHLTFDDGPNGRVTNPILAALQARRVQATFFVSTHNLEGDGQVARANREIVAATMAQGHLIASHGHEHNNYDLRIERGLTHAGMSEDDQESEINQSVELLNRATGGRFGRQSLRLFRFPYGRGAGPSPDELDVLDRNAGLAVPASCDRDCRARRMAAYRDRSPALQMIAGAGFSHVGWNHDSGDTRPSAPQANSEGQYDPQHLALYIRQNLQDMCSSSADVVVALFHDIKRFNAQAIPVLMDVAACLQIDFVNAQTMAQTPSLVSRGVLIPRERILQGVGRNVERGLAAANQAGRAPDCRDCDRQEPVDNSCYSPYLGHRIAQCTGTDSICIAGEMESRGHPSVEQTCSSGVRPAVTAGASCPSATLGRQVDHCRGTDSICVNGRWRSPAQVAADNSCPNGIGSP